MEQRSHGTDRKAGFCQGTMKNRRQTAKVPGGGRAAIFFAADAFICSFPARSGYTEGFTQATESGH